MVMAVCEKGQGLVCGPLVLSSPSHEMKLILKSRKPKDLWDSKYIHHQGGVKMVNTLQRNGVTLVVFLR